MIIQLNRLNFRCCFSDSCDTEKEEEVVEYISDNDLITLGWIHVGFLSFLWRKIIFFDFDPRHIQVKQPFYPVWISIHISHIKC